MSVTAEAIAQARSRLGSFRRLGVGAFRLPLWRNSLTLALNSGLTSLLGVVYWALAAHRVTPAQLGLNAALIAAMTALANVTQLGLGSGLTAFLPRLDRAAAARLVRRVYGFAAVVSLALGAAFAVAAPRFFASFSALRMAPLAIAFVASVAVWAVFGLQDCVLTGLRRPVWIPVENILYSIAKLGLLFALAGGLAGWGVFAAWALPAVVTIPPVWFLVFRRLLASDATADAVVPHTGRSFTRFVAADSFGLLLAQLSTTLLPVLVVARIGADAGGRFYIPWMIAQSLDLLATAVGMSLTVEGSRPDTASRALLRRVMPHVLALVAALAALAAIGAPLILRVFGPDYPATSTTILRVLLLGSAFKAINGLTIAASRAELATTRVIRIQATLVAVIPAGVWLAGGAFGLVGAAAAWPIGQACASVVSVRSVRNSRRGDPA